MTSTKTMKAYAPVAMVRCVRTPKQRRDENTTRGHMTYRPAQFLVDVLRPLGSLCPVIDPMQAIIPSINTWDIPEGRDVSRCGRATFEFPSVCCATQNPPRCRGAVAMTPPTYLKAAPKVHLIQLLRMQVAFSRRPFQVTVSDPLWHHKLGGKDSIRALAASCLYTACAIYHPYPGRVRRKISYINQVGD